MRNWALLSLLPLAIACQDSALLQPDVAEAPSLALVSAQATPGSVVARATGSGHYRAGADNLLRTFSFSAIKRADGHVTGQFQMNNRARDVQAHGTVTCLAIVGNGALIGGVVESVRAGGPTSIEIGQARAWLVVDNGEGGDEEPDRISGFRPLDNCEIWPPWGTSAIEAGNIQIMER